jgi:hypothetical protein
MRTSRASSSASAPPIEWSTLLADAVSQPGVVHDAYRRFWHYSTGNQLLAWFQCHTRKIELGPINTFAGWLECCRHVKKGERALTLCMPVTGSRKKTEPADASPDKESTTVTEVTYTRFVYRARWFVLAQTEGENYRPPPLPDWDEARALSSLKVEHVSFAHPDGNCQGYARGRTVAISPIAFAPYRTLFHELAHVLLGHTAEHGDLADTDHTPRDLGEVEAEAVALICAESLGLGGSEYSRGYLQHWLKGRNAIPEQSAHRVFKVADQILKAGHPAGKGGDHA